MELLLGVSIFITVTALLVALLTRPASPIQRRLQGFHEMTLGDESVEREPSFVERVLRPVAAYVLRTIKIVLPTSVADQLEQRLVMAGEPIGFSSLLIIWACCAVGLPLLYFLYATSTAGTLDTTGLGLLLGIALVGAAMPYVWLNSRRARRQKQILKSLPDGIDLLTTSVEAGLGIDAALGQVAEKVKGPLAVEFRRVLRESAMGSTRRDALKAFADRTGVPDVQQFVNALIQAEQMGVSLGQVIRVQADQMRMKRRQRAEEKAHKAPVKITIPLVLFIFPTILVVILGPACIQLKDAFPK